jgi:hypothetical protein
MKIQGRFEYQLHSFNLGFDRRNRVLELSFTRICRYLCRWLCVVFEGFKKFDWVSYARGHHDMCNRKVESKSLSRNVL